MNTRAALQSASIFQIFLQIRLLWCLRRKRRGERKISGILKQCFFFCRPLGICAVHLPDGLSDGAWNLALNMYKAHQKDTNWGAPSPICEGRLSVVGCRLSEKSGLASCRFQRAIFQSACGWTKTHRWRILYLCKIQHPTNQPVLNFPLSHLALPFWAWPKKSQPSGGQLPFVTAVIREDVWTCPGTDQADLRSESWYFESSDGGPDSMATLKTFIPCTAAWSFEFGKMCQETDIRIAEVKRDAYEFRPGIELRSSWKISKTGYAMLHACQWLAFRDSLTALKARHRSWSRKS